MSTKPVNVEDYRILAQRRLPKIIFDYLEGGADDEIGMKHNRKVFERYRLMPRRLVDVMAWMSDLSEKCPRTGCKMAEKA